MITTVQILNTEEEWHAARAKVVATASEAAILIGHDSFNSPAKLRKKEESTFKGNAYTIVGQILEPVVVELTNRVLGTQYKLYEELHKGKVFFTKGLLGATPDATDGVTLLECKSTKPDNYLKFKESPPLKYLVQLLTQMSCTDVKEGCLAIMSTDLSQSSSELILPITVYKVVQNDELCAILQQEGQRFLDDENFKVNSAIKKQCKVMLDECYTKIYMGQPEVKSNSLDRLTAMMRGGLQK